MDIDVGIIKRMTELTSTNQKCSLQRTPDNKTKVSMINVLPVCSNVIDMRY